MLVPCLLGIGTSAHLTVFWGTTPIAVAYVAEGRAAVVSEDGRVIRRPAGGSTPGAVTVRVDARGAAVTRVPRGNPPPRGRGAQAPDALRVAPGTEAEVPLSERCGSVYRSGIAWQPEGLGLRIEVSAGDPACRRRPAFARSAWLAMACSAAAHGIALALAAASAPPPAVSAPASGALVGPVSSDVRTIESSDTYADPEEEEAGSRRPQICAAQAGPIVGRSILVQGQPDNPDPHVARRHAPPPNDLEIDVTGKGRGGGDPIALVMPWGRDDSLGWEKLSTMGALPDAPDPEYAASAFAACFGDPHGRWSCSGDLPEPPSLAKLGLSGIGDDPAPPPGPRAQRRPARVALGPIAVAANVPRWIVVETVRSLVDDVRACYERALVDTPTLTGRFDVVLRVRDYESTAELSPKGEIAEVPALRCCVQNVHEYIPYDHPIGMRANAGYSMELGSPAR